MNELPLASEKNFTKNNPRVTTAWAMYDWANSVYSLVITSTIFPIYYNSVTKTDEGSLVPFFGMDIKNTALYSFALAFSFLAISIISPFLSGIADYTGNKMQFMKFFVYLGAISCASLAFFDGDTVYFGLTAAILASIGFSGSLVFYNAFLPEIATPDRHDRLSAKGFSYGYVGSVILLVICLLPMFLGIDLGAWQAKGAFILTGLWWAGFAQITFLHVPEHLQPRGEKEKILTKGFRELKKVFQQLTHLRHLKIFLLAFFLYSMGVQTVMLMAASFGDTVLNLPATNLIATILVIQIVAILGASFFARLSGRIGNIKVLITIVTIWIGISISAWFIQTDMQFYALAAVVGLVMGGIQSMSRSTYSKMLPETRDHASFFSFYDISEKVAIVIGMATFGLVDHNTDSMRNSVFALVIFFAAGLLLLLFLNKISAKHRVSRQY